MQITIPDSWQELEITPELANAYYIARGKPSYRGFSPNIVITRDNSITDAAFEWNIKLLDIASQDISNMKVLDLGSGELLGREAGVSLATFTAEYTNVTQLQFSLVVEEVGYVLTFTCATADFSNWYLPFTEIAQSFVPQEAN